MTGLRSILGLVFLMTTALVFGEIDSPSPALARAADLPVPCNLVFWPSDIQNRLNGEFGSWKVQEPENLSEYTRKTWAGKKLPGCPGIAMGLFLSLPNSAQNPSKRPKILGIAEVRIWATNLPASLDFYSKTLNLAHDVSAMFPDENFLLNPFQGIWVRPGPTPMHANLIDQITFITDDIPALRRYLVSYQVSVSDPAGYYFTVVDPEGHRIGFMERREWPPDTQSSSPATHSTFRLIHAGIIVHDRAAEDHFYKDILGFQVYWHGGMKDDETNWVDMQVPDGTDWLEYMLNLPANADKRTLGVMNHIALGVPDIHPAEKQLRANGWNEIEEPKIGRDGKWQLNLYDPDDTRVELMEFMPVQKPCCSEYTEPHPKP
jgi:catechol 2,3-dioxygenase-like lactoylglutathione lyase family enzyme